MKSITLLFTLLFCFIMNADAQEKVTFKASDGLEVTADCYETAPGNPMIVLCHQAGWSRGEYKETAKWLNENGFNCLAVDQRSGDAVNKVSNETAARAKAARKGQEYLDALPDVVAAVNWAADHCKGKVIVVGSSYSASLVLKVAKENDNVYAVAAFSPGEYFGSALNVGTTIDGLAKPTFITASRNEMAKAKVLAAHVNPANLTTYTPTLDGHHGSRALWTENKGHEGYRDAFLNWLKALPK